MSKSSNIKWRKSDQVLLSNTVRSFNAKRTRLIKKVPELEDFLPEKLVIKNIKESIKTRKDFNRAIKSFQRFLKKGAEKTVYTKQGVKTTAYEVGEMRIKVAAINRERARILKKMKPSTEKGTMGSIKQNSLMPKQFNLENMSVQAWQKFVESVEKQSASSYWTERYKQYKENYLKAFDNQLGGTPKAERIRKLIEAMPAEQLDAAYYQDPNLQIDFVYDEHESEWILDLMEESLNIYLSEGVS